MHERYAKIIGGQPTTLSAGRKEEEDALRAQLSEKFEGMMKALYNEKGASLRIDIMAESGITDFIETHASVLDSSMAQVPMSDTMRSRLQRSNYVFSGLKTFHELNEAFPSLIDSNGDRKPFEQFYNDVQKIDSTYNKNYLRSEYNFIHSSAEMAAKWEGFSEDGDRYYLQYRTAGDDKVRPEHAAMSGVTLPMTDKFWDEYYPPNGWNCRCTVVQVRKSKQAPTPHDEAMALGAEATGKDTKGMFHFNPGKEQRTVPKYNPYTISKCRTCNKGNLASNGIANSDLCAACQLVKTCYEKRDEVIKHGKGNIRISNLVSKNDSDYDKLYQVAEHFAKDGAEVILTPKMSRPPKFKYECFYKSLMGTQYEGKCPDLCVDGRWYEHEGFVSKDPKRAFRNMMNDGLKQSDRLIIDKPNLTDAFMKRIIYQRIKDGQQISEVWLRTEEDIKLLYKKLEER